ncbi:hypothetical protein X777_00500, partial [Ooceraea biroi]
RRIRILGCRYNLTRTGYKYLEIGKCVPPTADAATVNIALGDTTCKEIMLTAKMWKGLVGSRTLICDNLARANSEHGSPPPVYLDDLAVRFATINGQPTIRLNTPSGQLTLPEPTVHYLFGLRHCVERAIVTMKLENNQSVVSKHRSGVNHEFDWHNVDVLHEEKHLKKREIAEMFFIKRNFYSINLQRDTENWSGIYDTVLNNMWY